MKRFEYYAPRTLTEAFELWSLHPEAVPLAGGTDILVQMKERHRPVDALLSLKHVPEVHALRINGAVSLGAAVPVGRVASHPSICQNYSSLSDGAILIGSLQIRNMATVGGNICNASPSADTAPGLLALGAQVLLISPDGQRTLPLDQFFLGPGKTALQPVELLQEIRIPPQPERSGSAYARHTPRASMDLAFVGVAASLSLDPQRRIVSARIALGAVAPTPIRSPRAEAMLVNQYPHIELFEQAGQMAAQEARPIDDLRASAEYRSHIVSVLTRRVLSQALARAEENHVG